MYFGTNSNNDEYNYDVYVMKRRVQEDHGNKKIIFDFVVSNKNSNVDGIDGGKEKAKAA